MRIEYKIKIFVIMILSLLILFSIAFFVFIPERTEKYEDGIDIELLITDSPSMKIYNQTNCEFGYYSEDDGYIRTTYNSKDYYPYEAHFIINNNTKKEFLYCILGECSENLVVNSEYSETQYAIIEPNSSVDIEQCIWLNKNLTIDEQSLIINKAQINIVFQGNFARIKTGLIEKSFYKTFSKTETINMNTNIE